MLLLTSSLLSFSLIAEEPPGIVLADPNAPDRGVVVRSKKNGRTAVLLANPKERTGGGGNSGIDNAAWMIGDWTVVVQSNYESAANAIADRIVEALAKE